MSLCRIAVCGLLLTCPSVILVAQAPLDLNSPNPKSLGKTQRGAVADALPSGAILRMGSSRLSHSTWLTSVQFSADDQMVGAADSSGVVRLWDVATGKLIWEKPKSTGRKLAFSPDGTVLAIGGYYNRQTLLWDLERDESIRELPVNSRSIVFSEDGSMLATAGQDAVVRLWNPKTGELLKEFAGHQGALYAVSISKDGRTLASGGGGDGTSAQHNEVRIWDIATGNEIAQLKEDDGQQLRGWIYAIDFSADGKTLAVASPYAVRIWDIERRKQIHRLDKCSYDVSFSPTANLLVTPGDFGIVDPKSGLQVTKLHGDVGVYGCVAYSHSGKMIASGNQAGYVQLWDAATGKEIVRRHGHKGGIRCVDFSPDGTVAASISRDDASIRIWGTATGNQLAEIPVTWRGSDVWWSEEGSDVLFAPYGGEIITWTYDSLVRYWRLGSLEKRGVRLGDTSVVSMTFSKDGTHAAGVQYSGGSRIKIGVYELDGGTLVATLDPMGKKSSSDAWVSAMAFSPDGETLAVGILDQSLRDSPAPSVQIWNVKRETIDRRVRPAVSPPGKICFSPDGTLFATSPTRGSPLQLWRTTDGSEIHQFKLEADAHGREPVAIDFSADGKLLAAADANHEIYVWELATHDKVRTLSGHQKAVTSIAFSPDGKTLLSGSEDATMLLWEISASAQSDVRLTQEQLRDYWDALADGDTDIAAASANVLLSDPRQTIQWMESRLTAGEVIDDQQLPLLIADLGGDDVRASLRAAVRLKSFGSKASPALFQSLAKTSSASVRRRIEDVLQSIGKFPIPPKELQRTRAIQLLEQIGSENAVKILSRLARTSPATKSSEDAKQALQRLKRRSRAPKARVATEEDAGDG